MSPLRIASLIGFGPRYFGRREGWILRTPFGNSFIISSGKIFPNPAITPKSLFKFFVFSL
jgi:hypothetical protein